MLAGLSMQEGLPLTGDQPDIALRGERVDTLLHIPL